MNFDFVNPGNGPEVVAAGAFTIIAVVGSVLLALWSQRRDFDRREVEMKSTFQSQAETEWSTWRRHMAERAMGIVTAVAQAGLAFHNHGRPYLETHHEVDEIHSLLHLDPHPSGPVVGDWLKTICRDMDRLRPINSQEKADQINETAAIARAKIMAWAYNPDTTLTDESMTAAASTVHKVTIDGG